MARDFDGTNDRLYRSAAPVTAAPFSVHLRLNPDNVAGATRTFFSLLTTSNNFHGWYFSIYAGGSLRWEAYDGTTATATASASISTGAWASVLGVEAAADSRTVYLNGGNSGTNATSKTPASVAFTSVGAYSADNGTSWFQHYDGKICDVAIWNVALSAANAAELADGFSPHLIRPDALVSYWPIIGRNSPENDVYGAADLTVDGPVQYDHPPIVWPSRRRRIYIPSAAVASELLPKMMNYGLYASSRA